MSLALAGELLANGGTVISKEYLRVATTARIPYILKPCLLLLV